jgi:hypothetical protein
MDYLIERDDILSRLVQFTIIEDRSESLHMPIACKIQFYYK